MKIEGKDGLYTIIPENENIEEIAIALILSSYELANPFGLGHTRHFETELTSEMARKMLKGEDVSHDYAINLNKTNEVYMDYVFGRCCKTFIKIDIVNNEIKVNISPRDRNPEAILTKTKEKLERK